MDHAAVARAPDGEGSADFKSSCWDCQKEDDGSAKVDTGGTRGKKRRRGEEEEEVVEQHDTANGDAGSMFANLRSGFPALMFRPLSPGNLVVHRAFVSQS